MNLSPFFVMFRYKYTKLRINKKLGWSKHDEGVYYCLPIVLNL